MTGSACTLMNKIDLGVLFHYNSTNNSHMTTAPTICETNNLFCQTAPHVAVNSFPYTSSSSSEYTSPKIMATTESLCNFHATANMNCDSNHSFAFTGISNFGTNSLHPPSTKFYSLNPDLPYATAATCTNSSREPISLSSVSDSSNHSSTGGQLTSPQYNSNNNQIGLCIPDKHIQTNNIQTKSLQSNIFNTSSYKSQKSLQKLPHQQQVKRKASVAKKQDCTTSKRSGREGDYRIRIGDTLQSPNFNYEIKETLGRGTFGQVVKCLRKETREVVAVKILKGLKAYAKQGQIEIKVLKMLSILSSEENSFVKTYETFKQGPHICIAFELLSNNLYEYLRQHHFKPLPLTQIRPILQQVLKCLSKLKELNITHGDLKPENIMLVDPLRFPLRVKVIDFGSALTSTHNTAHTYLQSRYYRAPEVILGLSFNEAIDMWSLGCVASELYLGWPLYPGSCEYDQIRFIVETQGYPPRSMLDSSGKTCRFFKRDTNNNIGWMLKTPQQVSNRNSSSKETRKFILNSLSDLKDIKTSNPMLSEEELIAEHYDKLQFVNLVCSLLSIDPLQRMIPKQTLAHQFLSMSHLISVTHSTYFQDSVSKMQICCQPITSHSHTPTIHHYFKQIIAQPLDFIDLTQSPSPVRSSIDYNSTLQRHIPSLHGNNSASIVSVQAQPDGQNALLLNQYINQHNPTGYNNNNSNNNNNNSSSDNSSDISCKHNIVSSITQQNSNGYMQQFLTPLASQFEIPRYSIHQLDNSLGKPCYSLNTAPCDNATADINGTTLSNYSYNNNNSNNNNNNNNNTNINNTVNWNQEGVNVCIHSEQNNYARSQNVQNEDIGYVSAEPSPVSLANINNNHTFANAANQPLLTTAAILPQILFHPSLTQLQQQSHTLYAINTNNSNNSVYCPNNTTIQQSQVSPLVPQNSTVMPPTSMCAKQHQQADQQQLLQQLLQVQQQSMQQMQLEHIFQQKQQSAADASSSIQEQQQTPLIINYDNHNQLAYLLQTPNLPQKLIAPNHPAQQLGNALWTTQQPVLLQTLNPTTLQHNTHSIQPVSYLQM